MKLSVTMIIAALSGKAVSAAPSVQYNCAQALNCIAITEEIAADGTCGNAQCVKKVCLILTEDGDNCPSTVSHMCDQANGNGCPYDGPGYWDSKAEPFDSPPCQETSTQKCDGGQGPPVGTTMCQYGEPGDTLFWLIKKGSSRSEPNSVETNAFAKCYMYKDWKLDGIDGSSTINGLNTASCSGNSAAERVIEYTIPSDPFCVCPPTFCGCGTLQTLDFAFFSHGDYVNDLGNGITVDVTPFGNGIGNDPRVYDTSRDVDTIDPELEDPDLDCTNDGKALIIQEGPDEPDRLPDDSVDGGLMTFYFDQPTDISSLRLLDTESRPRVTVTRADGTIWQARAPVTGDCGIGDFDVEQRDVVKLEIKFPESGAISELKYCQDA